MPIRAVLAAGGIVGLGVGLATTFTTVEDLRAAASRFPAVSGEKGGQDIFGPYAVVAGWPKDIGALPGNEKWTWRAGRGVFAESPIGSTCCTAASCQASSVRMRR
jgi:hypothetical protein